jgi:predicted small integral membrane protein
MNFEWMAWTPPTAIFFATIAVMLAVMTALEIAWPTHERRGLLPWATTRGDRLFLALLSAAFIHLGFIFFTETQSLWIPLAASCVFAAALLRLG